MTVSKVKQAWCKTSKLHITTPAITIGMHWDSTASIRVLIQHAWLS